MKDLQLVREYNSFFPLRQSVICPIILTLIKVVFALSLNHIQRRYMVCHDLPKYWFSFYVTHTSNLSFSCTYRKELLIDS